MTSVSTDRRFGVNGQLAFKAPVRAATTANITLSGTQTVDGVALAADDRVLVKDQSTASQNGLYDVSSGAWTRCVDSNGNRDIVKGTAVLVTDGTSLGGTVWKVSASNPITIGTSSISWERALTSAISTLSFIQSGPGAVTRDAQGKMRELFSVGDFGIVSNGTNGNPASATDQTSALVALLTALGGASYRGWLKIPYGTRFTVATVYAAVPVGIVLDDESSINWGQPTSYMNRFRIFYSGDAAADDSQQIHASGHHPCFTLLNMGTAGTTSATKRLATIMYAVGRDYAGDLLLGWMLQFKKDEGGNRWMVSLRLQTPYNVAIANPQLWTATTVYAAGAYSISDSGKVYKTTAGGTSGGVAPTGTGSGINDGGVLWDYVQSALNIDATHLEFDEDGDIRLYGTGNQRSRMEATGLRAHYFDVDTSMVKWVDETRGVSLVESSSGLGMQLKGRRSFPFVAVTGTTPALTSDYAYVNNATTVNMTDMGLPTSQTEGYAMLLFGTTKTTVVHGSGLVLRAATSVTPAVGSVMEFIKYPTHSGSWIEMSRNFST